MTTLNEILEIFAESPIGAVVRGVESEADAIDTICQERTYIRFLGMDYIDPDLKLIQRAVRIYRQNGRY